MTQYINQICPIPYQITLDVLARKLQPIDLVVLIVMFGHSNLNGNCKLPLSILGDYTGLPNALVIASIARLKKSHWIEDSTEGTYRMTLEKGGRS